jgi:hypothetical protein
MQKASIAALFLASSLAATALLPVGCGTGQADSLFDEAPTANNNPDATASASGAGGSGGSGSTSSGNPSTSSSTTGGGMGGGDQGGMGGMGGMGGGGMGGMGGSPDPGEVLCADNMTCSIANLGACCWAQHTDTGNCVQGPNDMDNCTQSQSGGNTRIECQSDVQCDGGEICCGDRANGNFGDYYWQVTCQDECQDVRMCAKPGPDPSCPIVTCQQGQQVQGVCKASQLLPIGYFVCGCP